MMTKAYSTGEIYVEIIEHNFIVTESGQLSVAHPAVQFISSKLSLFCVTGSEKKFQNSKDTLCTVEKLKSKMANGFSVVHVLFKGPSPLDSLTRTSAFLGVIFASVSSGLGELSFLSSTVFFDR